MKTTFTQHFVEIKIFLRTQTSEKSFNEMNLILHSHGHIMQIDDIKDIHANVKTNSVIIKKLNVKYCYGIFI